MLIKIKKSAEVRSQFYIAKDIGYINQKQFDDFHGLAVEVARIIGGLRATLKKKSPK